MTQDRRLCSAAIRFRIGGGEPTRWYVGTVAAVLALALAHMTAVARAQDSLALAQQQIELENRKSRLEVRKNELEIEKLEIETLIARQPSREWLPWLLAVATPIAAIYIDRRRRRGALDQAVHEKRLEVYPQLVQATEPLAIYFPSVRLSRTVCAEIGRAMRMWYFGGGGLLMSTEARDAYFKLARALTRASSESTLSVPELPKDVDKISAESLKQFRKDLGNLDGVEEWVFGKTGETDAERFQDFVFLQRLSSDLRTKLSQDLSSRRRPS